MSLWGQALRSPLLNSLSVTLRRPLIVCGSKCRTLSSLSGTMSACAPPCLTMMTMHGASENVSHLIKCFYFVGAGMDMVFHDSNRNPD